MPTIPTKNKRPVWAGERKAFDRMACKNVSFYNSTAWRTLAKAHKASFPLCVNHAQCKGVAHTTDHITPINQGGGMYDWDNLQSLCWSCNKKKTGAQAAQRRTQPPTGGV